MNRMPYKFDIIAQENEDFLIQTYWYGSGTISSSLNFYLLQVKKNSIQVVFHGSIFYESKQGEELKKYNSFYVHSQKDEIIVRKKVNDVKQFSQLVIDENLDLPIPDYTGAFIIKDFYLPK